MIQLIPKVFLYIFQKYNLKTIKTNFIFDQIYKEGLEQSQIEYLKQNPVGGVKVQKQQLFKLFSFIMVNKEKNQCYLFTFEYRIQTTPYW